MNGPSAKDDQESVLKVEHDVLWAVVGVSPPPQPTTSDQPLAPKSSSVPATKSRPEKSSFMGTSWLPSH